MSILNEIISFRKNPEIKFRVCLFKDCLRVFRNLNETNLESNDKAHEVIYFDDIAGTTVEEPYAENDKNAFLILNTYPICEKNRRTKVTFELVFEKYETREENLNIAKIWHNYLESLINYSDVSIQIKPKPFLVFVNPNSGSGKASNIFLKHVTKVWNEASLFNHIIVTLYPNHARECIMSMNLDLFRGIIVISGDGLVHEVINGLLSRKDWEKAIKIPVGQIPAGSANGLSATISYLSGEDYTYDKLENYASLMAFCLIKFKSRPLDLVSIQLENGKFIHSFINIEWAIVADVDLESEKFRFLGGMRFLVGAIKRITNLRIYKGRISFLPAEDVKEINFKDKSIKLIQNTNNYTDSEFENSRLENKDLGLKYKYLKPLNEPVPNDWLTIEDEFVLFLVVNLPLMGIDFFVSPETKFDDGSMMMTFVRKGIPRLQVLKLLNDAGNGTYLQNPYLEFVKIKAFRLEPLPDDNFGNGTYMIDGEKVHYGAIQGEVLPGLARVISRY